MPRPRMCLVIPALNEESAIGEVLDEVPNELIDKVVVVDNGSTDETPQVANAHKAEVVFEPRRGYGNACLAAIRFLRSIRPTVVVFMDGDYSSDPREISELVRPLLKGDADLVIGRRIRSKMEKGAMPIHAKLGNRLALYLLRLLYGRSFTDLGPFRAITWECLEQMNMRDQTYGWNVEMMIKALRSNMRVREVDVSYRKRIGKSKISGSLMGSVKAGYRIIATVFRYWIS